MIADLAEIPGPEQRTRDGHREDTVAMKDLPEQRPVRLESLRRLAGCPGTRRARC